MSRWMDGGVRAVFFDAVGTLLHPDPPAAEIYASAARKRGIELGEDTIRQRFLAAFASEEAADRECGWVTSEAREVERWRRIVANTLREAPDTGACFAELYSHFARPDAWRVDAAAAGVFEGLAVRGVALGIASNFDSRLWPVVDGHGELSPVRGRVVVSAAVGFRKPAKQFFEAVARAAVCEPTAILMVGDDRVNDHDGAAAAGLRAVLLDRSGRHGNVPRRIRNLTELLDR